MANVLLINPPQMYRLTQIATATVPPIGACYVAAFLRQHGHNIQFIDALGEGMSKFSKRGEATVRGLTIDEIVERIPSSGIDIIGITNLFSHAWPVVRDLAREIKNLFPDIPIITGGVNQTSIPEFILSHGCIDYVVLGEGELTALELVDRIMNKKSVDDMSGLAFVRNGKPVVNERRFEDLIKDLDILPWPAYDLIPIENYINAKSPHGASRGKSLQMIATRGCPYTCTFCTAPRMWLPRWRSRSAKHVVDEMEHWNKRLGIDDFHFEDLTMIFDRPWALDFTKEILKRGLKISWQMPNGTRSEIFDDEVCDALKASGCSNVAFAPESGCPKTLSLIEKDLDLNDIVEGSKRLVKKGFVVCAFFAIAFPHDTYEDIKKSFKFMRKLAWIGVHEISICTFTALPGSKLFYKLRDEGRVELTDKFFTDLLYMSDLSRAASWIEGVSPKRIARWRRWGYMQFFFISYLCRPWRLLTTLFHIISGVENTKVERIGHAKINDARLLISGVTKRRVQKATS